MKATKPFHSSIPDVVWPAVPGAEAARIMAVLYQLDESQWWTAERVLESQFSQLTRLLGHAYRTIPLYRARLDSIGWDPAARLTPELFRRIPILTREEIQDAGENLICETLPSSHGKTTFSYTSGSTGKPVRVGKCGMSRLLWQVFTLRDHLWHGRDFSGKLVAIRGATGNQSEKVGVLRGDNWGQSSRTVFHTGPSAALNLRTPPERQVPALLAEAPDYLITLPSVAKDLALYCLAEGIRIPSLRQLLTLSEVLDPSTRETLEKAFGVPVIDIYTSRDAGYLALQCPEATHYHVQSEGLYAEVVDDEGQPVPEGKEGRLIITPLHNFAMPLIRYEIGDSAVLGGPCACGRGLPVLQRILGRTHGHRVLLPTGERRWLSFSNQDEGLLMSLAPVRHYQLEQESPNSLKLHLGVREVLTEEQLKAVKGWIRDIIDFPLDIEVQCHGTVPRAASGKRETFVSRIPAHG